MSRCKSFTDAEGGCCHGDDCSRQVRITKAARSGAACLVLLVAAGLFVRSLQSARNLDPGFGERNALLAEYDLKMAGYTQERGLLFFHREVIEKVRALPGVRAATFATAVPLEWESANNSPVLVEGYQPAPDEQVAFQYNIIGPDYFETMQIAVLEGRGITLNDNQEAPGVVVVNETAAKQYCQSGKSSAQGCPSGIE